MSAHLLWVLVIVAWIAAGMAYMLLLLGSTNTTDIKEGLRRGEVAAFTAVLMFITIWPVVFVVTFVAARIARVESNVQNMRHGVAQK